MPIFHIMADIMATPLPHSDSSIYAWVVLLITVIVNTFSLWRNLRTEKRAAKKDEFETIVKEYKELYEKAEKIIKDQAQQMGDMKRTLIEQEKVIKQQNEQIGELRVKLKESERQNGRLQKLLNGYEKTTVVKETLTAPESGDLLPS